LGWNQELWRQNAAGITFPLAPCLCCYSLGTSDHPTTEMFAWIGGGALPHHVNAMGCEVTSPVVTGIDATHTCAYMGMQEHVIRVAKILDC
jgi:hypothetical protein